MKRESLSATSKVAAIFTRPKTTWQCRSNTGAVLTGIFLGLKQWTWNCVCGRVRFYEEQCERNDGNLSVVQLLSTTAQRHCHSDSSSSSLYRQTPYSRLHVATLPYYAYCTKNYTTMWEVTYNIYFNFYVIIVINNGRDPLQERLETPALQPSCTFSRFFIFANWQFRRTSIWIRRRTGRQIGSAAQPTFCQFVYVRLN